ncbi:MAG: PstS family phosphate ABC transporter substrate-binding protein [Chloroflexota bacterium]|nr:PstS family phosphate ABC transporter substrate-binding protein [Dehalococcoidia bacterium]MDW8047635.1 PstS family phosphate ABC transporter substrate-binding protein [Chloroflexota bacterium]
MLRAVLFALAPLALLAIAACGGDDADGGQTPAAQTPRAGQTTEPDLRQLRGEIIADGSSTVYPVTAAAAEEFAKKAPNVRISVGISGTGGGFKKFCAGETDIQDASRPIDPAEREVCQKNGIEFIELPVAFDGLSVIVNPKNDWAQCLTVQELKTIWSPESQGKVTRWNQVRSTFPDRPLVLFGAGTDSGTFDYFTQAVNGKEKASRGDYQATEDDNVTITGVAGDVNALGYLGFAYVVENQGKVKPVAIDKGDGKCVDPSFETIRNGTYQPLSRPIFIYVRKEAAERPEVQAFIRFYLSKEFTELIPTPEVGYVPLPDEIYAAVLKRFEDRVLGTLFPNGPEVGATLDRYLQAR